MNEFEVELQTYKIKWNKNSTEKFTENLLKLAKDNPLITSKGFLRSEHIIRRMHPEKAKAAKELLTDLIGEKRFKNLEQTSPEKHFSPVSPVTPLPTTPPKHPPSEKTPRACNPPKAKTPSQEHPSPPKTLLPF